MTITLEEAHALAAEISALRVPAHVESHDGVRDGAVVKSYSVEAVLRSPSTGSTAVWSSSQVDTLPTAQEIVSGLVAEIKARGKRTRAAIRSERAIG